MQCNPLPLRMQINELCLVCACPQHPLICTFKTEIMSVPLHSQCPPYTTICLPSSFKFAPVHPLHRHLSFRALCCPHLQKSPHPTLPSETLDILALIFTAFLHLLVWVVLKTESHSLYSPFVPYVALNSECRPGWPATCCHLPASASQVQKL